MKPYCRIPFARGLAAALAVFSVPAALAQASLPTPVLQALQAAQIPAEGLGLYIREVAAPQPLVDHRGGVSMNPASTMKLVTTLAALDTLGPGHTWQTDFLSAAPPRAGVVHGPLYIKGRGDPKFTWQDLQGALQRLRDQGIHTLSGDVILDRSYFGPLPHDPGQFDGEPFRPYNVGPDALLYNFKAIGLRFTPLRNGKVQIDSDMPLPDGLHIDNRLRTHRGVCGDWRTRLKPVFSHDPASGQVTAQFSGNYGLDCGERSWYVSLFGHDENSPLRGSLQRLWRDLGGQWSGELRSGKVPAKTVLLHRHPSPPLATVVTDVNKFSNNVMARQLLLTFDAERQQRPATPALAAQSVRAWLRERKLELPELVIENGSGLSRRERIAPRSMARLLEYAVAQPYAADYMSSLPLAGTDGTLLRRFRDGQAGGNAYLKTGTLNGVKSLAGYLLLPQQRMLLFVAFVNHPNAEGAQQVLDAAVDWAYTR